MFQSLNQLTVKSNLAEILTHYGFSTEEQKQDVIRLLYLSGCFDPKQLELDLLNTGWEAPSVQEIVNAVKEQWNPSTEKNIFTFNPKLFLDQLFISPKADSQWPEKIHNWFIKVTQREFFSRKKGQERWEQETGQWMIIYEKEIKEIIKRLKLLDAVLPQGKEYIILAVFGATAPEMERRLKYAKKLVDEFKVKIHKIYLLTGERNANTSVDGGEEYLKTVAEIYHISLQAVQEKHLMQEAYYKVKGNDIFSKVPMILLEARRGNKARADTVDTLLLLQTELEKEVVEGSSNRLFISGAPNLQAQAEAIYEVFDQSDEVVGDACSENIALSRVMGALGGAFFGGYVRVAKEMGSKKAKEELKETLKTLSFDAQMRSLSMRMEKMTTQLEVISSTQPQPVVPEKQKAILYNLNLTIGADKLVLKSETDLNKNLKQYNCQTKM